MKPELKELKETKPELKAELPSVAPIDADEFMYCVTFRGPVIIDRRTKKEGAGTYLLIKTLGAEFFAQDGRAVPAGCYNKLEVELTTGNAGMRLGEVLRAA